MDLVYYFINYCPGCNSKSDWTIYLPDKTFRRDSPISFICRPIFYLSPNFFKGLNLPMIKIYQVRHYKLGLFFLYLCGLWFLTSPLYLIFKYYNPEMFMLSNHPLKAFLYMPFLLTLPFEGIAIGALILILTRYGVEFNLRWAWYLLLLFIFIIGIPNVISQILFNFAPLGFFPLSFSIMGLTFTAPKILGLD